MIAPYLLFFFAGLGAFNGLALAAYLLWRRPAPPTQAWLAVLVLAISLRTGKSVLLFFSPDVPKLVLQLGLTACFLIGPCLFGFVRAWADPATERTRNDRFIVAGLLALAIVLGAAFPYADHPDAWGMPVWHLVTYSWLGCLLASLAVFLRARPRYSAQTSADGLGPAHVAAVIAGVAVVWLAYFTVGLTSYIVGALSFSLVLYLSGIVYLAQRASRAPAEPYQHRRINDDEASTHLHALQTLMIDEALYADPQLNLVKVARRLGMPPARLSQLLNDNNKTTFKQYLMQLRVEAAKRQLRVSGPVRIEDVAEAAGFLSMSTFYSSFKKVEGITPAAWRQARQDGSQHS